MTKAERNRLARLTGGIRQKLAASSLAVASCGAMIAIVMVALCAVTLYQGRLDAQDHTRVRCVTLR